MSSPENVIPIKKLKARCAWIGVGTLISSIVVLGLSISGYTLQVFAEHLSNHRLLEIEVAGFKVNVLQLHVILAALIIFSSLWMLVSLLLLIGIAMENSSFLMCYFMNGIIVNILLFLAALFMAIYQPTRRWRNSLAMFMFTFLHMHWLCLIHSLYERMLKGAVVEYERQQDDEAPLADGEAKEENP